MVSSLLVTLRWYLSEGGVMGPYPYIAQGIAWGLLEVKAYGEGKGLYVDYVLMWCYDLYNDYTCILCLLY